MLKLSLIHSLIPFVFTLYNLYKSKYNILIIIKVLHTIQFTPNHLKLYLSMYYLKITRHKSYSKRQIRWKIFQNQKKIKLLMFWSSNKAMIWHQKCWLWHYGYIYNTQQKKRFLVNHHKLQSDVSLGESCLNFIRG